ncbi:hypothetical protein ABMC89_06440 [Sulfitobacter sp. HNIBRBA3233]|uniref:TadE/TadG family type IV pilus assembly protein n=1 Tax=Sulfitobacter marinivivus TaxID=3158558 RepID=UPI0032DF272D
MFTLNLKSFLRGDFLRKEDGAIALETVIIIPIMFWAYMSALSIFDAFRQYSMHQKGAYTISDMISRETVPIDANYLAGAHRLFDTLTRSPQDSTIRVSVVYWDARNERIDLDWSQSTGRSSPLTASTVRGWGDRLPNMVDGERLIIVETSAFYSPPFRTGLENREIQNFIFTRPRYAPQVLWDDGSDTAPGV